MTYTREKFWVDRRKGGFRDAVTNALMFLLPEDEPEPTPEPVPEPTPEPVPSPGNSGTAHEEHKPPKKPK